MKSKWIKLNLNGIFIFLCLLVALLIVTGFFVNVRWLIFGIIILLYPISMRIGESLPSNYKTSFTYIFPFIILTIAVMPIELACAHLSYYTIGVIYSGSLYVIVLLFNIFFFLVATTRPTIGVTLVFTLALFIIPYHLFLGNRLIRVQAEAARIVTYAYEQKLKTGEFPTDFSDYKYEDSAMKKFIIIDFDNNSDEALRVSYWVGNKNASYWFSSKTGWNYRPD